MRNEISSKMFYNSISKGKNEIQIIFENKKISFVLNQQKIHEEKIDLNKNCGPIIIKHEKNYILNGTNVELIELFNGMIMQLGIVGISIYKNFEEFLEKTVEYYSKKSDVIFYGY